MPKTRKSRGGALLGYGSFGSVFDPPLYCENPGNTITANGYVSKAVYTKPSEEHIEMRIANMIRSKFDREFIDKYTILPEKQCPLKPDTYTQAVQTLPSPNRQELSKRKPNTLLFLKKANGSLLQLYDKILEIEDETSLQQFLQYVNMSSLNEFKGKLATAFYNLTLAVKELHKQGIYHGDLSRETNRTYDNVMYVLQDNNIYLKLIDFGIAKTTNNLWNLEERSLYRKDEIDSLRQVKEEFIDLIKQSEVFPEPSVPPTLPVQPPTNFKKTCKGRGCTIMGGHRKRTRKLRRLSQKRKTS